MLASMTTVLPEFAPVTPERVVRTTRLLFAALAALLGPLAAFWMFRSAASANAWAPLVVLTPLLAQGIARTVVRGESTSLAAMRVLGWSVLAGIANGVLAGGAWRAMEYPSHDLPWAIVAAFGGIYGAMGGVLFGVVFAGWTVLARAPLRAPSALGAQLVRVNAGFVLVVGGTFGFAAHSAPGFEALSAVAVFAGLTVITVALVAIGRMWRFTRNVVAGSLAGVRVVPRTEGHHAPALAWVPPLDHVVVHVPEHGDGVPFRENSPERAVAVVDLGLGRVQGALRTGALYSIAVFLVITAMAGALMFRVITTPDAFGGLACTHCAH